ncbi:MAG TPA: hypothetical protein PLZ73_11865 [bacterium]|nr:hypothetical protein [bacterium]
MKDMKFMKGRGFRVRGSGGKILSQSELIRVIRCKNSLFDICVTCLPQAGLWTSPEGVVVGLNPEPRTLKGP